MDDGRIQEEVDSEQPVPLDPEQLVSMNFWGFPGAIFDEADRGFRDFLRDIPAGDVTAEYLLPVMVDQIQRADPAARQGLADIAAYAADPEHRHAGACQTFHRRFAQKQFCS